MSPTPLLVVQPAFAQPFLCFVRAHSAALHLFPCYSYRMQHQMLQEILVLFDSAKTPEEDAAVQERVLETMQRMQEYGQPPRELMAELAPNMFFGNQDAAAAEGDSGALPKDLEGCPVQ